MILSSKVRRVAFFLKIIYLFTLQTRPPLSSLSAGFHLRCARWSRLPHTQDTNVQMHGDCVLLFRTAVGCPSPVRIQLPSNMYSICPSDCLPIFSIYSLSVLCMALIMCVGLPEYTCVSQILASLFLSSTMWVPKDQAEVLPKPSWPKPIPAGHLSDSSLPSRLGRSSVFAYINSYPQQHQPSRHCSQPSHSLR